MFTAKILPKMAPHGLTFGELLPALHGNKNLERIV
jgi:hypothetical protein